MHFCPQRVCFCISSISFLLLIITTHFCSDLMHFCIHGVSVPLLIIPCVFLLACSAYLHQELLSPIADGALHVSGHRECVSALTVLLLLMIVPWSQEVCFCTNTVSFPLLIVPAHFCSQLVHVRFDNVLPIGGIVRVSRSVL